MIIGYICKYTPVKLLESMSIECVRIEPSYIDNGITEAHMHPNVCTYVKGVLTEVFKGGYDGIILVNCCDSVRRLYDVLKNAENGKMIYMLDLPRKSGDQSVAMYASEIKKLIQTFTDFYGKKFNVQDFIRYISTEQENAGQFNMPKGNDGIRLAIMGARCNSSLIDLLKKAGADEVLNYTCTGDLLNFMPLPDFSAGEQDIIEWYAGSLIRSIPCMRMADIDRRRDMLKDIMANVNGIVYHTIKFCEFYSYEYSYIKDNCRFPILKIETDFTQGSEGQLITRIGAFVESLKGSNNKVERPSHGTRKTIVAGIDSGSLSTDVVILDEDYNILSYSIVPTGASIVDSANKAFSQSLKRAGITPQDVSFIVSTGYGRINIPFANKQVTEITCHGKGAYFLNSNIRTIIDIGGQDSKVIRLDEDGNVVDFVMNDRCSAGTGRFLEVMAKALEIPLERMGEEAQKATEDINITSICTVFAESEVISLIAQNKKRADIIKGLHNSVASKTIGLLDRLGRKGAYMMTGGVAKNRGVVEAIEQRIGDKVHIPAEPQLVGALGAAILALQEIKVKHVK
ncbi:CoA-substrate-specific enzyme activase [Thermoanaerobacterium thermosaccharolyticum DSM 571]|uniref:CoA-substrate-specific enzyme activase n=1 Tax=Thermoanaerobacterium thermosaccharolyticum (strain ATCC 7956 / DSM 571 / NCIMB 9385 / NCA 3814 / NCTC 13789 / WDCM 00135 / 2032) TaxID=580327 RepID=D9TMK4_THETC|nr:acyl-CoA dehydratase activase [Thermoanaerobacterium thermosaccharolyticum]ADL68492.1 CoA-substrate-specific enzyme activase [Thermoanaerobacterium thermosaccharolyticum DSM 571]